MESATQTSLSIWQVWWLAIRPKTLPAALSSVVVACALTWFDGVFRLGPALAAMAVALLLQIGSNLANDVFDYERGVDTEARKGPLRVTQAGLLAPEQVKLGMKLVFLAALILWLYLAWISSWLMVAVGLLAVLAAITYTGGPFPFGAYGLGDPLAFLFFGPVAVAGAYFVQALNISTAAWWMSIPVGLIITAILVVNNLRDIATDRAAGRKTLAVRFGAKWARREYFGCFLIAYTLVPILIFSDMLPIGAMLSWGSLLAAWPAWRIVRQQDGVILNQALAGTGKIALSYSLLFAAGLVLSLWFQP